MLATIREFALEQLRQTDDASLSRRHDDYFLGVAEEVHARERMSGPRDLSPAALRLLDRDLPNLRATFAGLVRDGRADDVLRLGTALSRFWLSRAQYRDALDWLEAAPVHDSSLPADSRAAALASAGDIAFYVLDAFDRADALWQAGLELRRAQDDPRELGAALNRMASIAWQRGDFDSAIEFHLQALPLFEQAGDHVSRLSELRHMGETYRDRGDYDEARRILEETVSLARSLGSEQQLLNTVHSLGDLALDRGDSKTATVRYLEAMDLAVKNGNRRTQIYCIAGIACALVESGADELGVRLWGIAEEQERQLGFRMLKAERRRYEHWMSVARNRLQDTYEPAHRSGAELTLEEAVADLLRHVRG